MADQDYTPPLNAIAIVGLAGRFPGAESIEEFWRNLAAGVESVSRFTEDELRAAGVDPAEIENPDYVKARGLLKAPELFDAAFFGISNRDAELMDPQQRLFLETCWHALEHAAIAPLSFPGLIGVWGGMSTGMTNNTYLLSNLHAQKGLLQPEDVLPAMLGNENDYLTTRVSYKLHLRGPSVNVQSACSTSLVAVAQACQALLTWQCDAALAGGVSVSYPQQEGYLFQEGGIGSPDGHCRPFDASAQGTVFSNGVGVVVLRRLEDALADGQTIHAVIRGVAINNDGSSKVSFAAPSVDGQAEVIAMAHSAADVSPDTIDYIEAHGTGTPLGDPIEVAALTKAFRIGGATGTQFCALGSVKSNFGHLDSAAGVTGLIKTVLALRHAQLPPTLHFERPNPKCDLPNSPFFVSASLRDWPARDHPRRAGVSSFGIGGTNAHVVLEEAPPALALVGETAGSEDSKSDLSESRLSESAERVSELLVLSAKTATALDAASQQLAEHLAKHPEVTLADAAHTLRVGRQAFAHRRAIVCTDRADALGVLRSTPPDPKRVIAGVSEFGTRSVAFMFSGGGTQYVDMGRELLADAAHAPVFRDEIERCLAILKPSRDVRRALFPETAADRAEAAAKLEQPSWGLPALFAVEYAIARQWMAWGIKPDALIGHSMGEYTAACLAGVMSLEDALALVLLRGRLFETLPPGEMLGVPLSEAEVVPVLREIADSASTFSAPSAVATATHAATGGASGSGLAIAAINAPSSCVVSGSPEALAAFAQRMAENGVECRRLHIAVAAHSPMVDPILGEFERFFRGITLHAPQIPIASNVSGVWLTAEEARSPEYWARHLRQTVRFFDGLGTLLAEPNRILVEAGPGQTLCGFARQHPRKGASHVIQASMRHPKESTPDLLFLQQAVGRLWTSGVSIDWMAYAAGADRRRVPLPGYPFERKRFLIEPVPPVRDTKSELMRDTPITQAPPAPAAPPAPPPRADRIRDRLIELLHKLSGLAIADIDPTVSFLEMGFDSLFLTQASLRFKSEFKVKVTFRQLFEEAPTLDALAHYIDGKLPPEAFPAPAAPASAATPAAAQPAGAAPTPHTNSQFSAPSAFAPAAHAAYTGAPMGTPAGAPVTATPVGVPPSFAPSAAAPAAHAAIGGAHVLHLVPRTHAPAHDVAMPANASAIERVVQQQLHLMSEQLRLLGDAGLSAPFVPAETQYVPAAEALAVPERVVPPVAQVAPVAPVAPVVPVVPVVAPQSPSRDVPAPAQAAASAAQLPAFGPFRGIDKSTQSLTPHQQRYLDSLIERYTQRTKGSKSLTESQRAKLADPRAVSGFRKIWKEMIYQLATVRSEGSRMWDVDGNEYIDLTSGFGVNLFGYAVPFINDAVQKQVAAGIELGTLSPLAKEAADLICELTGMERATFANTGSESISGAIRAVRTVTGREWIAVFDDEYHGIAEEVLVKSVGARGLSHSSPAAPGIPDHLVEKVIVLHYDDPRSLDILRERADEIAGVIIEPVQNRHPDFRPADMIRAVRQVTAECDIPLIFDEMITGFRLHPRGAQGFFGVDVDIACYGKIMSGGLPIAAIAGKAEYLDAFDGGPWRFGDDSYPEGGVTFFGGTYTRNPLSLSAAVAALQYLKAAGPGLHEKLNATSDRFADAVNALFRKYNAPARLEHCGSIFNILFTDDNPLPRLLHYYLREKGIHIWDRPFFMSTAHTDADLATILKAWDESLAEMHAAQFLSNAAPDNAGPDGPGPGRGSKASADTDEYADADADADLVPFTDAQLEVWLGAQMNAAASCTFNESVALELRGPVNVAAMQRALAQVVARHESLRMTVVMSPSGEPRGLRTAPTMDVPLTVQDLTTLSAEAREAATQQAMRTGDTEAFDLTHGPLLRMSLLKLAADRSLLLMAAHHLVCDGWSFGIVLKDLSAFYSANVQHTQPDLPDAMQGREFAREALAQQRSEEAAEAESFWLAQFKTLPDPLELPADRPRPPQKSFHGERIAVTLGPELAKGAKTLAAQQRATLFTTLLGVYEALIFRLSGQDDFVVGIPVAGQSQLDQDLVAHCVNFVPLRATVNGTATFAEFLAGLRRQWLDVNEYQNFTYNNLLSKLRLPRDPSRNPLVSCSFTVEPAITDLTFHGLKAEALTSPRSSSKRDLHVNVMETPAGLLVEADFNTDMFDAATVRRWLEGYRCLLEAAIASPDRRLSDLPLMSDADRRQLLVEWNDTTRRYPLATEAGRARTIHQLVEDWAARTPNATALVCEETRLSWSDLNRRANQLARLLARTGITPATGAVVALCLERSVDFVVALIAAHKAGAAYLPIDPSYPQERIAFLLKDAGARATITQSSFASRVQSVSSAPVFRLDTDAVAIARESGENLATTVALDDLAYIIYTSGSTGQPKGVAIEHRQLLNYTFAVSERLQSASGLAAGTAASYALVSTVTADLGNTAIFPALATGGVLHVITQERASDGAALAAYFAKHGVDVLKITPTHLAALMKDHPSRSLLPRRCLVLGGESARPAWVAQLQRLAPDCAIVNHYGPTETTVGALTYGVTGDASRIPGESLPIGKPLGNLRAYVLDATGAPTPIGVAGELFIGGAGVARGYLNRADLTRERFVNDPFAGASAGQHGARMYRTGDRARWLADGSIEFLGRVDHQVKVRGFRVELGEIESTLRAHATVKDAVVLLREDTPGDQRLVAYVIAAGANPNASTNANAVSPVDLRAHVSRSLPEHAVPAAFVRVDAWPLTPNGKLDRKALPAPSDEDRASVQSTFVAVSSATEQRVAAMWTELLGVKEIGARDDFFLLGGHSLLAMRLVSRIHKEFGVGLSPAALFQYPILADLARRIDAAAPPAKSPVASAVPTSAATSAIETATPPAPVAVPRLVHGAAYAALRPTALATTGGASIGEATGTSAAPTPTPAVATAASIAVTVTPALLTAKPVSSDKTLIQIAPGGAGTPFYWVHGVGGEVFCYMKLSRHLATARPVYGFAADWTQMSGHEAPTLEVMAAHYIRELRAQQPSGPYHLGGFCSAAMLALEMARQLEADGQQVGVLAAIDYDVVPTDTSSKGLWAATAFLKNIPHWLREDALQSSPRDLFGRVLSRVRRVTGLFHRSGTITSAAATDASKVDLRDQLGMWRFPDYQVAMLQAHHHAIHSYQPKPFDGKVTLFLPRTAPLLGPWPTGHDKEWDRLARGGVEVHLIRGSHITMLADPFAAGLASRLNAAIEESETQHKQRTPEATPRTEAESTPFVMLA